MDCPLCMDLLELDDRKFYPCSCKYQICRFCWHRIRTDENGLCPACRKPYTDMPDEFEPINHTIVQQLKQKKKQRDMQRKQKIMDNKKELGNVRVVQRNLVFVVGLSARLANSEILRKPDYFGKFGKLIKVVINRNASYAGSQTHPQGPSASAYVTYHRPEDALRAIQTVNNMHMDGRTLRASLGTTKYCSNFMNNQMCPKMDCMYLHDIGEANATFTKEEMQKGLHQEFERKLHEKYLGKSNYTSREKAKQERLVVVNAASDTKHSKKNNSNGHTENNSTKEQKNAWLTTSTSKDTKRTRTRSERNADSNTTNDEHNNKGIRVRNGRENHEAAASNSSTSSSPSSEQSNPHSSNHNCGSSPSPSPSPPPVEETKARKGKNLQPSDSKKQRPKASSPMPVKGATSGENSLAATPSSLSSCSELSLSLPNTSQLETRSRRQKKNERQERNKAKNEISNDHNDSEEIAILDVIAVSREDENKLKNRDRNDQQKTKGKNKNRSKVNDKEESISSHSFFSEPNEVELDSDESKGSASSPVVTNGQYDSHDIEENDTEWPSISPDPETTLMCDLEASIEETQETTSPSNEPPWEAMFDMEPSTRLESPSELAEVEQKPVEDEIYVEDELGFDPFEETNKALANDILMERKQQQHHQLQLQQQQLLRQQQHQLLLQQKQQQIEQQNFQNQLRLQSGLKGLMDNYSVKDLLATRLPPPGFNGTSMSQPHLKHLGNSFGNTVSPPSLAQNGAALNRVGMTNGALNLGLNSNGLSMPLDTTSGAPPGLLSAGKMPGSDAFTLKDLESGLGGLGALRGAGNGFSASISSSAANPLGSLGAMQQSTQQSSISALFNMAQQQQQIQLQQQQLHQLQQQQHALSQQNLIHHLGTNFTNSTKGWPPSGAACELTALDPAIVSSGQVTDRRTESPAQPHWLKPLDADCPAWASNAGAVPSSFSLLTSRRTAASKHVSGSNLGWTAPSPPPGFNTISPMQHVKSQLHKIENL